MLSGDGGDELFLGYPIYRQIESLRRIYNLPPFARALLSVATDLASRASGKSRLHKAAQMMVQPDFKQAAYYLTSLGAWSQGDLRLLRGEPGLSLANESFLAAFAPLVGSRTALSQERTALLQTYLPDNNLARMDRASMANSVETRTPFLHPLLSDFAARLPRSMLIRGTIHKYVLRQALVGCVPGEIVRRQKHGFHALPMAAWMRHEMKPFVRDVLDPESVRREGTFDGKNVAMILNEHDKGGRFNHWWRIWLLLTLQMWLRRYAKPLPFSAQTAFSEQRNASISIFRRGSTWGELKI